jgi:predicted XRE-type DNA-binding protein
MTAKELVKKLMTDKGMTNAEMANALDITQAALWDRLNPKKTNNMTIVKLSTMLSVLGFKVVVENIETGETYEITE